MAFGVMRWMSSRANERSFYWTRESNEVAGVALPTGSEINPFVWSRSIAAQSKDFQVCIPS
jgi:hypothetical protein